MHQIYDFTEWRDFLKVPHQQFCQLVRKFDWKRLQGFNKKKFLLSGGIDLNSVDEINNIKNENDFLLGIDINSRFEISPGLKDIKKVNMFLKKLNK